MKIVVLDGYAANPNDISWDAMAALGELTVYDRTPVEEIAGRIGNAEAVFTNKAPITRETMEHCPNLKFISVLATGFNIVDTAAAKEKGILMMGDSNPHYELAPENILADTLCEYGPALYAQIERFVNGELESGTYYSSIREGGVGLLISPEIRGSLPADKQARFDEACEKIDQALAGIQSGELVIERNIEK